MPITITRSGEVLDAPEITQTQRDALWGAILQAYLRAHPEELRKVEHSAAER